MSKRGGRTLRISRRCIFCGGNKLTGEHIWPDWASPLLPYATHSNTVHITVEGAQGIEHIDKHHHRQGAVKTTKVRAVCGKCNSTWMNRIEEAARADLTAMILGRSVVLPPDTQRRLAEWITLKLMVAEHSNASVAAFPVEANKAFYEHREFPTGLSIRLFRSGQGTMRTYYYRNAMTCSAAPSLPATGLRKNLKSVALGIGELFIFAVFIGNPELQLDFNTAPDIAVSLLPFGGGDITWPPSRVVTEVDAIDIAQTLKRFAADPRTKWMPAPN